MSDDVTNDNAPNQIRRSAEKQSLVLARSIGRAVWNHAGQPDHDTVALRIAAPERQKAEYGNNGIFHRLLVLGFHGHIINARVCVGEGNALTAATAEGLEGIADGDRG